MRVYADTSFLVRLLTQEAGTAVAVADYRSLGRPPLYFLSLHRLEVANAIRQRVFHQRHTAHSSERAAIKRERETALSLMKRYIDRGAFVESMIDMEIALESACTLSEQLTERLGCRGFDLLHVALALELNCDVFLTSDRVQGDLARAKGLAVTVSATY